MLLERNAIDSIAFFLSVCYKNLVNCRNMKTDVYRLHIFGFGPFTRTLVFTKFVLSKFESVKIY